MNQTPQTPQHAQILHSENPRARTTCPICLEEIGPNDRLVAEWFETLQWFVLRHYRNVTVDSETVGGVKNFSAQTWCGYADHPAVRTLTEEWRMMYGRTA